jgi:hypothetical protein
VIGGWLVQAGSWRAVFFINVPLAAAVLAILVFRVAESRDASASRRIDVRGAAVATLGLGSLVYGLIRLQDGPGLAASAATVLGVSALVAFVVLEGRTAEPMMRLDLFASRTFSTANLYTFLLYAALGGSFYFVPFDLIDVQGYAPAAAGAALLPFVAIVFALSRFSGGLVARAGPRVPLIVGGVLTAAGFATFASAGVGRPYWVTFFPGAILLGFGGAAFIAPLTTTVMGAVASSHAGIASGINNAIARAAGLIAIAALGIALARHFDASLSVALAGARVAPATTRALDSARAQVVAGSVPPGVRSADRPLVARAIREAFAGGFRDAMLASAGLALLAALVAGGGFRRAGRARACDAVPSSR